MTMQAEEKLRAELRNTELKHVPVEYLKNLGEVSGCSCDPCKHINTTRSEIGNYDCLDCGEKEIDYQPCDHCLNQRAVDLADASLEFIPQDGTEINFDEIKFGVTFDEFMEDEK